MSKPIVASSLSAALGECFDRMAGEVVISAATSEFVTAVIQNLPSERSVRLVVAPTAATESFASSFVECTAAEYVEQERLQLRQSSAVGMNTAVADLMAVAFVSSQAGTIGLTETRATYTSDVKARLRELWSNAQLVEMWDLPLSRLQKRLADLTTAAVADGFEARLAALGGIDATTKQAVVETALLAGAKDEALFQSVCQWGDQLGIAAPGTFSRIRIKLERADIISTKKNLIDNGRPRLRLAFDDSCEETPLKDLPSVVA